MADHGARGDTLGRYVLGLQADQALAGPDRRAADGALRRAIPRDLRRRARALELLALALLVRRRVPHGAAPAAPPPIVGTCMHEPPRRPRMPATGEGRRL